MKENYGQFTLHPLTPARTYFYLNTTRYALFRSKTGQICEFFGDALTDGGAFLTWSKAFRGSHRPRFPAYPAGSGRPIAEEESNSCRTCTLRLLPIENHPRRGELPFSPVKHSR